MTIEQINQLVEKFPNDMQLGEAVRRAYWEAKKSKEVKNKSQLNIFDDDDRDDVILGYD